MIEKRDIQLSGNMCNFSRPPNVVCARLRIAARMIVHENEACGFERMGAH